MKKIRLSDKAHPKHDLFLKYIARGDDVSEIAVLLDISKSRIYQALKILNIKPAKSKYLITAQKRREYIKQNKDAILEMYKHHGTTYIAKKLNLNPGDIYMAIKRWGVDQKRIRLYTTKYIDQHIPMIIEMFEGGMSMTKIADCTGFNIVSIQNRLKERGYDTSRDMLA